MNQVSLFPINVHPCNEPRDCISSGKDFPTFLRCGCQETAELLVSGHGTRLPRRIMKMRRVKPLALLFLAGLVAESARADAVGYWHVVNGVSEFVAFNSTGYAPVNPIDPVIVVRHLGTGSTPFSGYTFTFNDDSGTGDFDFYNNNPSALLALSVVIAPGGLPSSTDSVFVCGIESDFDTMPFSNCTITEFGTDQTSSTFTFWAGPGLPAYGHFEFELTGFPSDGTVTVSATPSPEIEPLELVLIGLLGLAGTGWIKRRRSKI